MGSDTNIYFLVKRNIFTEEISQSHFNSNQMKYVSRAGDNRE